MNKTTLQLICEYKCQQGGVLDHEFEEFKRADIVTKDRLCSYLIDNIHDCVDPENISMFTRERINYLKTTGI